MSILSFFIHLVEHTPVARDTKGTRTRNSAFVSEKRVHEAHLHHNEDTDTSSNVS